MFLMCNWWHPDVICADVTGCKMLSEGPAGRIQFRKSVVCLYAYSVYHTLSKLMIKCLAMRLMLPAFGSLSIYHFSQPLSRSCVPLCVWTAQSCVQRLSALYSKPRRLAACLEASRLPQQTPCASFCPHLKFTSLRSTILYILTLLICMFSVFQTNHQKKEWRWEMIAPVLDVQQHVWCISSHIVLSPISTWLPEVQWSGRASWKLLNVTAHVFSSTYVIQACRISGWNINNNSHVWGLH